MRRTFAVIAAAVLLAAPAAAAERPGVAPVTPWACPASHPIKGYIRDSGRHVYFVPAHRFYEEASPDRCYASEDDARRDGAMPERETTPTRPRDPVV